MLVTSCVISCQSLKDICTTCTHIGRELCYSKSFWNPVENHTCRLLMELYAAHKTCTSRSLKKFIFTLLVQSAHLYYSMAHNLCWLVTYIMHKLWALQCIVILLNRSAKAETEWLACDLLNPDTRIQQYHCMHFQLPSLACVPCASAKRVFEWWSTFFKTYTTFPLAFPLIPSAS